MKSSDITNIFKETKNSGGKIAVAVEGGGLRGVVSATMLKIFEDLGLANMIDAVSGTSAGALNLAYFLNNNMSSGLELYKTLASSDFIQPFKWPNAMNLHFLYEQQIANHFPIDWNQIRESKCSFYISMTDVNTGQGKFVNAQETSSVDELLRCVKASTSAPLFSTNIEEINDHFYNDGQVQHSIPIQPFMNGSYDVLFCLLTRKRGYRKSNDFISTLLQKMALRNYTEDYKREFSKTSHYYNEILDVFSSSKKPKIIPLCLEEDDFIVSKMTKDPNDMQKCIDATLARFT